MTYPHEIVQELWLYCGVTNVYPITMDQQAGDILRRRRYKNLLTAPVPLGNGIVDPPAQQLTALDIDARIDWYGSYLILQEQVMLINEDPVLNSAVSCLGQSLRETEDQLARSMMEGGKMCAPYKFSLIDLELLAA